ncbi:MAG: glycosyltransferase [Intestinibacter bartlettii]|uniref:glycosyltransferase n=1 Tax=Intestinibacter bartlettii TaxID=261299 RepID=UPI002904BEE2|nr:glycosyltransferase [Intestinibacter bartlettii]MDU2693463.1 glycosyltransferase [Intestinibacter bartlettii]
MIYIKKRLLFVNGHLNVGGVEKSLVDLLKAIDYDKYEVDLVLFEELGDYIDEIPKDVNVKFYDLTNTYGAFLKCIFGNLKPNKFKYAFIRIIFNLQRIFGVRMISLLNSLFKDLGTYDCAIAYRIGICSEFVAYVVDAKRKITWWHHGSYDYNQKQTKTIEQVYDKFDYVVSVSQGCKDMILENVNISPEKIVVIPNIIDFDYIQKKSLEKIEENLFDKDFVNIVSIGRLSPEKGMINCVLSCKQLMDLGYKIKWFLIGDGVEYKKIKMEIEKNKLEENIFLLGRKKNPYSYLRYADIYVHPSYVESMSITVLEAMCLDKPLVVVRSIGPSEFIRDGENGLLVDVSVDGIVNGVKCLINNRDLYEKLSCKDKIVLNKYKKENVIKQLDNLIKEGDADDR